MAVYSSNTQACGAGKQVEKDSTAAAAATGPGCGLLAVHPGLSAFFQTIEWSMVAHRLIES